MFINQNYIKSFLEAFVKFWDQLIISSRAYGDRVLLFATSYKILGSRGLSSRKKHLSALIKESGRSFKILQLPDVSEFGIILGLVNPLLLAFGLVGRHSAEITMHRYRNRRMNKYLIHIVTILIEHLMAGRVSRFWTLSMLLVRRSNAYMVFCSWKIDKNLYRNLSLRSVAKVFREVNHLRSTYSYKMDFKRTYIPKGETHRPLGVPTLPWRIYLNMLLHPLVLAHPLPSWQHGFKPGAGTLTAWITMFREVITSPNIFEGDLRQCFPSVNLLRLAVELYKQGMPANVLGLYHQLNMVSPKFKGAILLNENQFLIRDQYQSLLDADPSRSPLNFDKPIFNCTSAWLEEQILLKSEEVLGIHGEVLLNFLNSSKDQPQHEVIEEGLMHIFTEAQDGFEIQDFVHYADWLKWIGTAQGSPLSPYLSAIALMPVVRELPEGVKALFYADDFILYGPGLKPELLPTIKQIFAQSGFTIHDSKSQFVKVDGSYVVKSLKFLGLSLEFATQTLRAATRKGSTLLFNKSGLTDFEYDMNHALSHSPSHLLDIANSFYAYSKKMPGLNGSIAWGVAVYYYSLSKFRNWFSTMFHWELFALLRSLLQHPIWLVRRFITLGVYELRDLESARAYAKTAFSEETAISPIVDKSDTRDIGVVSQINPDILSDVNYVNPYLRDYRSKYTFANFCVSKYKGLIMSRLYSGSWILPLPLQNFKFGYQKFSLAQLMRRFMAPTLFNGSSIAVNVLVRSLSASIHSRRFSQKFSKKTYVLCQALMKDSLLQK